jgi:hypothetical protein
LFDGRGNDLPQMINIDLIIVLGQELRRFLHVILRGWKWLVVSGGVEVDVARTNSFLAEFLCVLLSFFNRFLPVIPKRCGFLQLFLRSAPELLV